MFSFLRLEGVKTASAAWSENSPMDGHNSVNTGEEDFWAGHT